MILLEYGRDDDLLEYCVSLASH